MSYVLVIQPPGLPVAEYRYTCTDAEHAGRILAALKVLGTEIIDIEQDGESLTMDEYAKLVGE